VRLEPPRWRGGPPICAEANLPAFADRAALNAFVEQNCSHPLQTWRCHACGQLHFAGKPPAPSGGSSNTEREYDMPEHIMRLVLKGESA
jgi:hypothetical protein